MPGNKNKLYALIILLLLLVFGGTSHLFKKREQKAAEQMHAIATLALLTRQMQAEALAYKTNLSALGPELIAHTVSSTEPIEWCITKMKTLAFKTDLELDCEYQGPEVPFEMQIPRALRQSDSLRHPYLAPYTIRLSTSGSLKEFRTLFEQMESPNQSMIIRKLNLQPDPDSARYQLSATLAFPHMLYIADENQIKKFLH